eukprot:TRINITY_DN36817_c0_g1_i1.p1 TRINITY_DN36817_c0_g1~~TRINITY_DN36817_c0_g1_i1.p1  ORF type:complete len:543 (-),score=84.48 TRINITY_DN36817_c0_g1_i1:8-1615(-)
MAFRPQWPAMAASQIQVPCRSPCLAPLTVAPLQLRRGGARLAPARLQWAVSRAQVTENEGVRASRFAQLQGGLRLTAALAAIGSLAALVFLLRTIVLTSGTQIPAWQFWRSQNQGTKALVALSTFLSAHPLEYPGLLMASSFVAGACEAARRVGLSANYRSLYLALLLAGICSIFDTSALTQQTLALNSPGAFPVLFWLAFGGYVGAVWAGSVVHFSEAIVGGRAILSFGWPGALKGTRSSILSKLYALAEGLCVFEMLRSPLWRAGRLLLLVAALDELRRASANPEQLSSPESSRLNQAAGVWAWASLLEAALLGATCASWARRLGETGGSVAATGVISALVAALPAVAVLLACFTGWAKSEATLMKLSRASKRNRRRRKLAQLDQSGLEILYIQALASHYDLSPSSSAVNFPEERLHDCDYFRLKYRLQQTGSGILGLGPEEIRKQVLRNASTQTAQLSLAETSQARGDFAELPETMDEESSKNVGSQTIEIPLSSQQDGDSKPSNSRSVHPTTGQNPSAKEVGSQTEEEEQS